MNVKNKDGPFLAPSMLLWEFRQSRIGLCIVLHNLRQNGPLHFRVKPLHFLLLVIWNNSQVFCRLVLVIWNNSQIFCRLGLVICKPCICNCTILLPGFLVRFHLGHLSSVISLWNHNLHKSPFPQMLLLLVIWTSMQTIGHLGTNSLKACVIKDSSSLLLRFSSSMTFVCMDAIAVWNSSRMVFIDALFYVCLISASRASRFPFSINSVSRAISPSRFSATRSWSFCFRHVLLMPLQDHALWFCIASRNSLALPFYSWVVLWPRRAESSFLLSPL